MAHEGDLGLMLQVSPPTSPLKPGFSLPGRPPHRLRRHSSASQVLQSHAPAQPLKNSVPFPTAELDDKSLAGLRRWILCIALVNFDLDLGPDLDSVYPPTRLTALEQANIAFASMPETSVSLTATSSTTSFTHFSWRIPRDPVSGETEGQLLLGYVCFMQKREASAVRGFVQRSLVIVTQLPDFSGLFASLMNALGPAYMADEVKGSALVEVACRNIAKWPAPKAGSLVELPFLGKVLHVDIPLAGQAQSHDMRSRRPTHAGRVPRTTLLACVPLTPLSLLFKNSLGRLWLLWELVVTAEPILVYAPGDPATASEIIQWLVTLIRPLPFGGDWRPLFTLQQSDHAALLKHASTSSGLILGVTSPLIFSNCKHFNNILKASSPTGSLEAPVFHPGHAKSDSTQSFKEASEANQGLFSDRRRVVARDEEVFKAVEGRVKAGDYLVADALLIRHFTDLTERLLVPLNRYFATIQPQTSPGVASRIHAPTFDMLQFKHSLKTYDSPLKLRRAPIAKSPGGETQVVQLYDRFIRGRQFGSWLRARTAASVAVEEERAKVIARRFEHSLRLSPNGAERDTSFRPRSLDSSVGRSRRNSDAGPE